MLETYNTLILDTHIFLWLALGVGKSRNNTIEIIDKALNNGNVSVSRFTIWEIYMLAKSKRMNFPLQINKWVKQALMLPGLSVIELSNDILYDSINLPDGFHKDPADRIIVATTRCLNATLITKDTKILQWASQGHVRCFEA